MLHSLHSLGILPGETLLLCGKQPPTPELWLESIWEVLGPDGTLLTHHPLLEVIRQHPGSQAYGMYCATGARASALIHPHRDAYGFDSPVGRLFRLGGRLLLIGADLRDNIGLHLAASMALITPCQAGFWGIDHRLRELPGFCERQVQGVLCQAMPMTPLVNLASKLYCQEPESLRCQNPECPTCYRKRESEGSSVK